MSAKKIIVLQTRSGSGHPKRQKETLKCLGLGRIGKTAEHQTTPSVLGMIRTVSHLVEIRPVA